MRVMFKHITVMKDDPYCDESMHGVERDSNDSSQNLESILNKGEGRGFIEL